MFYHLLVPLAEDISVFNVFRYLTFRSGAAVMTALVICFVLGPTIISWLKERQGEGQPIRQDGPAGHLLTKQGTPTMGGALILTFLGVLVWTSIPLVQISNLYKIGALDIPVSWFRAPVTVGGALMIALLVARWWSIRARDRGDSDPPASAAEDLE